MSYSLANRKIGDGYTWYLSFTHTGSTTPYGEKTMSEIIAGAKTFGGSDPSGLEINLERDIFEDEIAQELAPVQTVIMGEKATAKLTINAGGLDNLTIMGGRPLTDQDETLAAAMPGSNDADHIMVGGNLSVQSFGICHKVSNSYDTDYYDWFYAPYCSADPTFAFKYSRDDIRKMEATINIHPAKQDGFLDASTSRHGLFQVLFEKLTTP